MAGQTVVFEVATQHSKAVSGFLEVVNAAEATGRAGGEAGEKMRRRGEEAGDAWDKGLGILKSYPAALAQMATGASAVYMVVATIRAELERIGAVRAKALEGLDQAMEPYKRATLQFSEGYRGSPTFEKLNEAGIRARGDAPSYFDALSDALSAAGGPSGGIGEEETHRAVNLISEFAGKEGLASEDYKAVVAGMIDSLQVERRMGNRLNAKELLGTMISGWPASRPTKMGDWATHELLLQNLLIQNSGFSREESIGLASTFGSMMIDPTGRRTRTASLLFQRGLAEAYQNASIYGAPATDERGQPISIERFRKMGLKQLEIARSDTETGKMMRGFLAPSTEEERNLGAMMTNNPAHMGSLEGEAGGKEVGQLFLDPTNNLLTDTKKVIAAIKHGAAAEKLVEDRLRGPIANPHDEFFAARHAQKGLLSGMKWSNVQQARRGSLQQFMQEAGDIWGTGAMQQWMINQATNIQASGKDPREIRAMERQAAAEFIDRYIDTAPYDPAAMEAWLDANRRESRRGFAGQAGATLMDILGFERRGFGARSSYPPEVQREYMRRNPPPQIRGQVQALEGFIESSREIDERVKTGTPGANDQSNMMLHAIGELRTLISSMMGNPLPIQVSIDPINVTVEDELGRQLGRTTSQPRKIEQLNDAGIG